MTDNNECRETDREKERETRDTTVVIAVGGFFLPFKKEDDTVVIYNTHSTRVERGETSWDTSNPLRPVENKVSHLCVLISYAVQKLQAIKQN